MLKLKSIITYYIEFFMKILQKNYRCIISLKENQKNAKTRYLFTKSFIKRIINY